MRRRGKTKVMMTKRALGGPAAAMSILRHLTQTYMDRHRGQSVVLERPMGGDGPTRALKAGLVDAAVTVEGSDQSIGRVFARTNIVLALGPGIEQRRFKLGDLATVFSPKASRWPSGVPRRFVPRSPHDPLHSIMAARVPDLHRFLVTNGGMTGGDRYDDPVELSRRVGTIRGGFALALAGNLRLYGAPVWIGQLPVDKSAVSLVIHAETLSPAITKFLDYLVGIDGQNSVAELGFGRGEQR